MLHTVKQKNKVVKKSKKTFSKMKSVMGWCHVSTSKLIYFKNTTSGSILFLLYQKGYSIEFINQGHSKLSIIYSYLFIRYLYHLSVRLMGKQKLETRKHENLLTITKH